jgi:lipopolysaccharide biosynthesis glycosyltransferase
LRKALSLFIPALAELSEMMYQFDYDYIMWIDSDIIFTTEQFDKLLSNNVDICGGVYLMEGGQQFAAVKNWNEEKFKKFFKKTKHYPAGYFIERAND